MIIKPVTKKALVDGVLNMVLLYRHPEHITEKEIDSCGLV